MDSHKRWLKSQQRYVGTNQYTFSESDLPYATDEAKLEFKVHEQKALEFGKEFEFVRYDNQGMNSGFHDARTGTNIKHYLNSWHNCQAVGKVNGELVTTSLVIWKGNNWILTASGSYYKFINQ